MPLVKQISLKHWLALMVGCVIDTWQMEKHIGYLVCLGDASGVGDAIDRCLMLDDLAGAALLSSRISDGLKLICDLISTKYDGEVIYAAGDNLCFKIPSASSPGDAFGEIVHVFTQATDLAFSVGAGTTALEAVIALRKAKVCGNSMECFSLSAPLPA